MENGNEDGRGEVGKVEKTEVRIDWKRKGGEKGRIEGGKDINWSEDKKKCFQEREVWLCDW